MQFDLTDEERDALSAFLGAGIAADKFPLSPGLKPLRAVLAKLDPKQPQSKPPPLTVGPAVAIRSKKRRTR
jgi:hypothetical protein